MRRLYRPAPGGARRGGYREELGRIESYWNTAEQDLERGLREQRRGRTATGATPRTTLRAKTAGSGSRGPPGTPPPTSAPTTPPTGTCRAGPVRPAARRQHRPATPKPPNTRKRPGPNGSGSSRTTGRGPVPRRCAGNGSPPFGPQDRTQGHGGVHRRLAGALPARPDPGADRLPPARRGGCSAAPSRRRATAGAPPGSWACSMAPVSAVPRSSPWPWCSPPTRTPPASTPGVTSTPPPPATCSSSPKWATPPRPSSASPAASSPRQQARAGSPKRAGPGSAPGPAPPRRDPPGHQANTAHDAPPVARRPPVSQPSQPPGSRATVPSGPGGRGYRERSRPAAGATPPQERLRIVRGPPSRYQQCRAAPRDRRPPAGRCAAEPSPGPRSRVTTGAASRCGHFRQAKRAGRRACPTARRHHPSPTI